MKRFLGSASHKRFSGAQLNVEHWREALETDALAPARARNAPVAPETALDSSVSGRKAQPPRLPGSLLAVRLRIVGVVALEDLLSHEVPERVLGHTVLRPPKSSSSSLFGARQQREARLQGRNHRTRLVLHVQLQVVERLVALTPIVHVDALDVVLEFALEEPQRRSFTVNYIKEAYNAPLKARIEVPKRLPLDLPIRGSTLHLLLEAIAKETVQLLEALKREE